MNNSVDDDFKACSFCGDALDECLCCAVCGGPCSLMDEPDELWCGACGGRLSGDGRILQACTCDDAEPG